ncbi:rh93 [macacine betaherpesvirus 3]|uniref:Rh93 n=1 Tax=Rhesus cytomegalovirus (strain 68-1) TaxID=47929 RepID=Q2FAM3_RHCM6|nr:rh93 [macacine betaherpesvirus 3]
MEKGTPDPRKPKEWGLGIENNVPLNYIKVRAPHAHCAVPIFRNPPHTTSENDVHMRAKPDPPHTGERGVWGVRGSRLSLLGF